LPSPRIQPSVLARDVKLVKVRNPEETVRDLIARLAASAPSDLPLNDRIELYKLAGSYDKIMEAINKQLSDSLDQTGTGDEADGRDDLLDFVKYKLEELRRDGVQVGSSGQTTANQLQKLREAKGWTEKADYQKALAVRDWWGSIHTTSWLTFALSPDRPFKKHKLSLLIRTYQE
jgi:hypothetical protein